MNFDLKLVALYYGGITEYVGDDQMAAIQSGNIIGQENLYTWFGDQVISMTTEPIMGTTTYTRIDKQGTATIAPYGTVAWNGQFMFACNALTQDTAGTLEAPTNYIKIRLPCKPGVSHALFLRFIMKDRDSSTVAYICNNAYTTFKRLQGQTSSFTDGGTANVAPVTSWIGPNGQMSASPQMFHEWQMFSIPQY
jgi:hypothetical protein